MRGNCREQETEMGIAAIDDVGTRRVSKRFIVFTPQGYINDNARSTAIQKQHSTAANALQKSPWRWARAEKRSI